MKDNNTDEALQWGFNFVKDVYGSLDDNQATVPDEISQDVLEWAMRSIYHGIWRRPTLDTKTRLMLTIVILATLNRREGLHEHIKTGLKNGITREEVCEILFHMSALAGLPATVESLRLAKTVFDEIDAASAS